MIHGQSICLVITSTIIEFSSRLPDLFKISSPGRERPGDRTSMDQSRTWPDLTHNEPQYLKYEIHRDGAIKINKIPICNALLPQSNLLNLLFFPHLHIIANCFLLNGVFKYSNTSPSPASSRYVLSNYFNKITLLFLSCFAFKFPQNWVQVPWNLLSDKYNPIKYAKLNFIQTYPIPPSFHGFLHQFISSNKDFQLHPFRLYHDILSPPTNWKETGFQLPPYSSCDYFLAVELSCSCSALQTPHSEQGLRVCFEVGRAEDENTQLSG